MRRIRLTVAYDGTNYHGWQVQPGVVTIESVLNEALTELFGEEIAVIGASRTDSGVHARGNVAACLLGEHDFKSFCSAKSQVEDTVRTIYGLDIIREGDEITLRIRGNGFLYNMVRIIAGTLLNVGNGHMEPEEVKRILEAKDRRTAGPTAPAKGLTLVGMEYEDF